jgi:hypothetical protein
MLKLQVENLHTKAAVCLGIVGALFLLAGCGGGGSGAPPTLNYTGVTTPVLINADNVDNLLTGVYQGEQTAAVFNIFGAVEGGSTNPLKTPEMLTLAEELAAFLNVLDIKPPESRPYAGAILSDSDTLYGSCGGSVYYDVGLDSLFGEFSGTADFRMYCDAGNPDLVLDGITDFSGDYEIFSQEIDDFTFIFRDLAGITSQGSYTLNGSLHGNVSAARTDVTTTSVVKDDGTGKTYWLKDFRVTAVKGVNFVDITVAGRYYDYDYGYVDVSTEEPLRVYEDDDWPASGVLFLTGAEGDAGGYTKARMEVLDADSYQIDVDDDGDGAFDNYNSGPLSWSDIGSAG